MKTPKEKEKDIEKVFPINMDLGRVMRAAK